MLVNWHVAHVRVSLPDQAHVQLPEPASCGCPVEVAFEFGLQPRIIERSRANVKAAAHADERASEFRNAAHTFVKQIGGSVGGAVVICSVNVGVENSYRHL